MRILYISNSSSISGAPAAMLNLVAGLKDRHEIAVVLPDSKGPLYEAISALGIRCFTEMPYSLTIWPRVISPVKYFRRICSLTSGLTKVQAYVAGVIDTFRPDIVHTNVGPLDLALDHCRLRSIPHVWHLREFQNGMTFWPSDAAFRSRILSDGNWNIAITSCVYDYWGLREKDTIIYDGVPLPSREVEMETQGGPDFLFVGRVERNKGLMELLKAFATYRRKGGKASLDVVGRVSSLYGLLCRMYVNVRGLRGSVRFHGQKNDVPGMMRNAKALIVCSQTEGFGLVAVEAMLEGCLVIGNDTTGMKEQFDIGERFSGGQIGIRYRGSRELAAALKDVDDGKIGDIRMKHRAAGTVRTCYDMSESVSQVEKFYNRILQECR